MKNSKIQIKTPPPPFSIKISNYRKGKKTVDFKKISLFIDIILLREELCIILPQKMKEKH
jgi:hypothetical protein